MKNQLINDLEVMKDTKLLKFCKFRFEIHASQGIIHKETFHQEFINCMNAHDPNIIEKTPTSIISYLQTHDNTSITFYNDSYRYSNLFQVESFLIKDGALFFEYSEYTDQSIIVPAIHNPVYMLLSIIMVCQKISNDFSTNTFSLKLSIHNNTRSCFDSRYSPIECKFNWLFIYELADGLLINAELNNISDRYNVARSFYQLFKTNIKSDIPYVILDQASFNYVYGSFFAK